MKENKTAKIEEKEIDREELEKVSGGIQFGGIEPGTVNPAYADCVGFGTACTTCAHYLDCVKNFLGSSLGEVSIATMWGEIGS